MNRVLYALIFAGLAISPGLAGQEQIERKVIERVAPIYPELARRANLTGSVRIEATVRPNGSVKEARVAGGNPVLCTAAVDAVRRWKFEPAPGETTQIVEIRFQPR